MTSADLDAFIIHSFNFLTLFKWKWWLFIKMHCYVCIRIEIVLKLVICFLKSRTKKCIHERHWTASFIEIKFCESVVSQSLATPPSKGRRLTSNCFLWNLKLPLARAQYPLVTARAVKLGKISTCCPVWSFLSNPTANYTISFLVLYKTKKSRVYCISMWILIVEGEKSYLFH